jgi:hypothetical protein
MPKLPRWIQVWKATGKPKPKYKRAWRDMSARALGKRSIEIAKKDLGYSESPAGSNKTKYGREWRQDGVPWCGMAVASWWRKAGHDIPRELALKIDYVPELVSLAKQKKHRLSIVHRDRVREGDAVAFDFDGGAADHVGLFEKWINKKAGTFYAIEGNTSLSSNDNGGKVMRRERSLSQVEAFVRKLR